MEISIPALFAALAVGTLLHPFVMVVTRPLLMKSEGSLGIYFKSTLTVAGLTLVCILLLALALILFSSGRSRRRLGGRRGVEIAIGAPCLWFVGVKAIVAHYLEREEIDEFMFLLHYAGLHAGIYWALTNYAGL